MAASRFSSDVCDHEELTEERFDKVNEALEEMYTHLEKLEDSNKLLRSFAAFGAGFLAARIAIAVTRLAGQRKKQLKLDKS